MFTIGICEDVAAEASWLAGRMEEWGHRLGCRLKIFIYENADRFWFAYQEGALDALFLDIKMPGEDGMSLAKKLRSRGDSLPVVFVTGEKEYMAYGYDVEALHYLLKPVQQDQINACLDKIYKRKTDAEPYLIIHSSGNAVKILQRNILKIEVFAHTVVYTTTQGNYEAVSSLKEVEEALQKGAFVKCHRGILVGVRHIETVCRDYLILSKEGWGTEKLPVSRRQYDEVNRAFIDYYRK